MLFFHHALTPKFTEKLR